MIANPNREVLLTLTKAGLVELIGNEWYFVRMHDAVQICLQHIQSLNGSPRASDSFVQGKSSFFIKPSLRKQISPNVDLEMGEETALVSTSSDHQLQEPLLSRNLD